jgi:hypothetical protein
MNKQKLLLFLATSFCSIMIIEGSSEAGQVPAEFEAFIKGIDHDFFRDEQKALEKHLRMRGLVARRAELSPVELQELQVLEAEFRAFAMKCFTASMEETQRSGAGVDALFLKRWFDSNQP